MANRTVIAGDPVELNKLMVPRELRDDLNALCKATGAPQSWHRRKALAEYLAKHKRETA